MSKQTSAQNVDRDHSCDSKIILHQRYHIAWFRTLQEQRPARWLPDIGASVAAVQAIKSAPSSQHGVERMQIISSRHEVLLKRAVSLESWLSAGGKAINLGLHANNHVILKCNQMYQG